MKSLQTWGLISITGPDRSQFLQGQFSCDVLTLPASTSCLGVHCSAKGRIIADFRLWQQEEAFFLFLPRTQIPILLKALKKYALFSKVQLNDLSDRFVLQGFFNSEPVLPKLPQQLHEISFTPHQTLICISKNPDRFLSIQPQEFAAALQPTRTEEEWLNDDIQQGIPHIFPESTEIFTPHQINYQLLGGISFKKGCYTGQEVIARMHYLGKLKQRMYYARFKLSQPLLPGTVILKADQEVGQVVQCSDTQEALVVLRDDCADDPTVLSIRNNEGSIETIKEIKYSEF